jgi:hypothetical protein
VTVAASAQARPGTTALDLTRSRQEHAVIPRELLAFTSLVLGMIAMGSAFLPDCAAPVALLAVLLGVLGLDSRLRGPAVGGIVLGWLGLLVTVGLGIGVELRERIEVDPALADYVGWGFVLIGIVGAVVLWRRLLRTDGY